MEEEKNPAYIVVSSIYIENIGSVVSKKMKEGYIPYGSLVAVNEPSMTNGIRYIQPMILKEEKKEVL